MRLIVAVFAALGMTASPGVAADIFSSKSGNRLFRSQTRVLDNRTRQQYNATVRLEPRKIYTPTKWGTGPAQSYGGAYRGRYLAMAKEVALRHGVPEDLYLRLVQQESGWKPAARSSKGAIGLAQLMPGTARRLGVDPHDPYENLEGGARYLAQQYRRFGSWRLALAAYNAGPDAVRKYGGVPPFKETRNYVKVIWGS